MEKLITAENFKNFAYVNDAVCRLPIRGIVLHFFGLGDTSMYHDDTAEGKLYGQKGILYIVPYSNPWAWMNMQTVALADELIQSATEKFALPRDIPVVSSGGSMGGQSALVYCAYAKRTPIACVANCPVCDTVYHYSERDDLPRTFYSALWHEQCSLEQALQSISPLHLVDRMPKIDYFIFHCSDDEAVNISRHSDIFVQKMLESGHSVSYTVVPGRGHCDIGEPMKELYEKYITDAINNTRK
ncbi:MAG: prolyl oligopeptidase family serine peptidase [Clostridiales bacterium]|nr:prolyl oligopeptidase family serine peptidase [Clostridiales bacterium]